MSPFVSNLYFKAAEYAFALPKSRPDLFNDINSLDDLDNFFSYSFIPHSNMVALVAFSRSFLNSSIVPNFTMRPNALMSSLPPKRGIAKDNDPKIKRQKQDSDIITLLPLLCKFSSTMQFTNRLSFIAPNRRFGAPQYDETIVDFTRTIINDTLLYLLQNTRYFSASLQSLKLGFPLSDEYVESILAKFTSLKELVLLGTPTACWPPQQFDPSFESRFPSFGPPIGGLFGQPHPSQDENEPGISAEEALRRKTLREQKEAAKAKKQKIFDQLPKCWTEQGVKKFVELVAPKLECFQLNCNFIRGNGKASMDANGVTMIGAGRSTEMSDDEDEKDEKKIENFKPFKILLDALENGSFSNLRTLALTRVDEVGFARKFFTILGNSEKCSTVSFPNLRALRVSDSRRLNQKDFARCCGRDISDSNNKSPEDFFVSQLDSLDISQNAEIGFDETSDWGLLTSTLCHFINLRVLKIDQYLDEGGSFTPDFNKILPLMPYLHTLRIGQVDAPQKYEALFKNSLSSVKNTLRELHLDLNGTMDDKMCDYISECSNLEFLNLAFASQISDEVVAGDNSGKREMSGIEVLAKSLKKLRYLNLKSFGDFEPNNLGVDRTLEGHFAKHPLPNLQCLEIAFDDHRRRNDKNSSIRAFDAGCLKRMVLPVSMWPQEGCESIDVKETIFPSLRIFHLCEDGPKPLAARCKKTFERMQDEGWLALALCPETRGGGGDNNNNNDDFSGNNGNANDDEYFDDEEVEEVDEYDEGLEEDMKFNAQINELLEKAKKEQAAAYAKEREEEAKKKNNNKKK